MSDVTTADEWTKPLPQPDDVNRPYWNAGVEGRLVIQQCPRCSHRQFYPRALCTQCGDGTVKRARHRHSVPIATRKMMLVGMEIASVENM